MRLARRAQSLELDRLAVSRTVGGAMAGEILRWPGIAKSWRIVILCGPGNNGGDGRAVARALREQGFSAVEEILFADLLPQENDSAEERASEEWTAKIRSAQLLVDAVFGVGLNRPLEGFWLSVVEAIRHCRAPVISLDLPSGLDADRGVILGAAVRADWTLTCFPPKPGLFLQEGPRLAGRVRSVDVGFPKELIRDVARDVFLIGRGSVKRLWPARSELSNKATYGRLLVLAGSPGMEGAAVLCARAGARAGAGYVCLSSRERIALEARPPDFLWHDFPRALQGDWGGARAVVIGPGLGLEASARAAIVTLLESLKKSHERVLVDADALTVCAEEGLWPLPAGWMITPHAGELSRFLKTPARDIENDRLGSAREAARLLGCRVLLKGFHTVIDNGERSYVIRSGNSALAKAGSGDVLAGFIGGLWAQGLGVDEGAALGAYIHGDLADQWVKSGRSAMSLMASDLPELFPRWSPSPHWFRATS